MRTVISLMVSLLAGCVADALGPTDVEPSGLGEGGKLDAAGLDESAAARGAIRLEVDFVGTQRFQPGTAELLRGYFASIGYDLGIEPSEELEPVDVLEYGAGSPMIRDYYEGHFDHRGESGWHYMLMGDTVLNGNRGWGMLGGDVFLISSDPVAIFPEHAAEAQANIILHELGHNLGLVHEGFEPELSAGTHSKATCATADRAPASAVPVVSYSPACLEHLRLESRPYVP